MPPKLRVTRNQEANELLAHIQKDADMMSALTAAVRELWKQHKAQFAAAGRSNWDPSAMLVPPTSELIITLIERKVAAMKAIASERHSAVELEALSKKAGLFPVADDILKASLPDYRPMSETGLFELVDQSTQAKKPWWQFW